MNIDLNGLFYLNGRENTLYVVFYKWQCFYFGHVARRALRTIPEILKNTCYGLMATFDLFEIDIREIP